MNFMFNISSYLEKFQKMRPAGEDEKTAAEKAIFEVTGEKIERSVMDVKAGVLHLAVSSGLKNEIYMNKSAILKKMNEQLAEKKIKDIR